MSQLQETPEITMGLDSLQGYELHDLVMLGPNEVGVVTKVNREASQERKCPLPPPSLLSKNQANAFEKITKFDYPSPSFLEMRGLMLGNKFCLCPCPRYFVHLLEVIRDT